MKRYLLLLLFPFQAFAQNTSLYFQESFGTAGIDISRSVKQLSSGSIYILGNSTTGNIGNNDISLTKSDKYGNVQWTEYYGTQNVENGYYLNLTSDGNLLFVAESETSFNDLDILIYKVDTSGNVIWNKVFATSVNESPSYVEQTIDGGFIITGFQNDTFGFNNALVLKLDASGNYQWDKSVGGTRNDIGDMVHQISNGNYILTGDSQSWSITGDYDVEVYELDSAGNVNWQNNFGDTLTNGCKGLLVTTDNNYVSFGEGQIYTNSPFDFIIQKIDSNGTLVWRHNYGGLYADAAFSGIETPDGGFVFTGYSNSYNGGGPIDLVVFKIDSSGTFLWKNTYGSPGIDIGYEIIKSTVCSGYVLTGYTTDSINNTTNYYLLQLTDSATISGVNETIKSDSFVFDVYPNPASFFISINYDLFSIYSNTKVVLYNLLGQEIDSVNINDKKGRALINVTNLNSGLYFCKLLRNGEVFSSKKVILTR